MIITIIGPMFSSKTTTLLTYERRFNILKKKILVVKNAIDTRYTEDNKIVSHDGTECISSSVLICSKLMNICNEVDKYDCILVDEGQFFPDLKEFCDKYAKSKYIVIAGLLSDFEMKPFQPIIEVLPISDKVIHLSALCSKCGDDAPFSARIINSNSQTLVGSSEMYEPRCRKCHTIPTL